MALNQIPHTHSDADNEALLSRVSKAADGTDTAYKDMVLCQVESVLMGDPLTPSPSAEPVAWRWKTNSDAWRYEEHNSSFPNESQPLYASPVSDASREALAAALREISEGKGRYSRDRFEHACNCIEDMKQIARDALAALSPSFDKTGGGT